jgi:hypothetical protein
MKALWMEVSVSSLKTAQYVTVLLSLRYYFRYFKYFHHHHQLINGKWDTLLLFCMRFKDRPEMLKVQTVKE